MTGTPRTPRTQVFVSYAHKDAEWLGRLRIHIRPLEREGLIDAWDDSRIRPGEPWKEAIARALDQAAVAVLLVSADFLASEFIHTDELPPLLARAERAGVVILPLIVGHCLFEQHPLGRYQSVNSPSRPLTRLSPGEQDEVYVALARAISERVQEARRAAAAQRVAPEDDRPRAAPAPAPALRPRILVAGPGFGLPLALRRALEDRWAEEAAQAEPDPERLRALVRDEMRRYPEVAQAQMAAIVRYDVIIDLSPWRAFARWHSLGFQDTAAAPDALRERDPAFWCLFSADEVPPLDPERMMARLRLHAPAGRSTLVTLFARMGGLIETEGLALSGLSGPARAWAQALLAELPRGRGVLVDQEPVGWLAEVGAVRSERRLDGPLTEVGLDDYLRALRVVAGQVRLTGETEERPVEEVFVEVALVSEQRGEPPRRRRERDEKEMSAATSPAGGEATSVAVARTGEPPPAGAAGRGRLTISEELEEEYELRRSEERSTAGGGLAPANLLGLGPRIFLRGVAGTGKSTLLRWLACREVERFQPEGRVPVMVALSTLRPYGELLEQCAAQALESVELPGGVSEAQRELRARLMDGRAVLLLDGFDEAESGLRDMLGLQFRRWPPALQVLVSSRPLAELEAEQTALPFQEVRLRGLVATGAETFLRRYFGEEPWIGRLLADLRRLPEGERWRRTPVLLALAATIYRTERQLPSATLELYEEVVAFLLRKAAHHFGLTKEDVNQARAALEPFCLARLLPERGRAEIDFVPAALESLPCGRALVRVLLASGLFIGEARLRFAHLTLGEYLAARAGRHRITAELERLATEPERAIGEVLPMAFALAPPEGLEQLIERARLEREDHRWLGLLLRALGQGGPSVARFAQVHAAEVLRLVAERFELASGRFAEPELELTRQAERALLALRPWLDGDSWRVFARWRGLRGRIGAEARILGWLVGAPLERSPEDLQDEELAQRTAEALVRAGAMVDWVITATHGEEASDVRAAAVKALAQDPESRALMWQLLEDQDNDVRTAALKALAQDPESRALLRQLLEDEDSGVRAAAVRALAQDLESRALLRLRLDDQDSDVRAAVVSTLAQDPQSQALLRLHLDDQDSYMRAAAVNALAQDPQSRALLRLRLDDQDNDVRAAAVRALAQDPESHALLRLRLDDQDNDVRAAAVSALAQDPESRTLLRLRLGELAYEVRAAAVSALAQDPESRALLRLCLEDQAWNVRAAAVRALMQDPESRTLLRLRLDDHDNDVRAAAVSALAQSPESRALLRLRLDDQTYEVRAAAVRALAQDPESHVLLRLRLDDQTYEVRAAAVRALAQDPESRALLRLRLDDQDYEVRAAAVRALAQDPESRALLRLRLDDQAWNVRAAAFRVLAQDPESRTLLRLRLEDEIYEVRAAAVRALAQDPESRALLRLRLDDQVPYVRAAAVMGLAQDPESRALLRLRLDDQASDVRAAAVMGLAQDPESRALLRLRLDDQASDVRAAAMMGLAQDPESRALLRLRLDDQASYMRAAAVMVLAQDPESRVLLRARLVDQTWNVRAAAVSALAHDPESRALLRLCLKDQDYDVCAAAVSVLARDPESLTLLRPFLEDRDNSVRAAAVRALAQDPESRALLWPRLVDQDNDVRAAAVSALAQGPESRALLRPRLEDRARLVRSLARKALRARPSSSSLGTPLATLPLLRTALFLVGSKDVATPSPTQEELLLQARLASYTNSPRLLHLEEDPALAAAVIGWLLLRLTWAAEGGELGPQGRPFGTLAGPILLGGEEASSVIFVRVAMDSADLPSERHLYPLHNLIEAWRVVRYLRSARSLTLWLACADVDFEDLIPPVLTPGAVHWGPTFYGFRLAEGPITAESTLDPLLELLLAHDTADRWAAMPPETHARALDALGQVLHRTDFDVWSLVPFLARLAPVLPEGMRARLGALLPSGTSEIARLLDTARAALGAPTTEPPQPLADTGAEPLGPQAQLAARLDAIRQALRERPADWEPALQVADELPALLRALPTLPDDELVEIVGLLDQLRDRHRTVPAARRLLAALSALPERPAAHHYISRRADVRHYLERFLIERGPR